jgi:hypothetical protein
MISQTLLSNVVQGAASGNYNGTTVPFYSNAVMGDVYRGDKHGVHTFAYFATSTFSGSIAIQASLVAQPTSSDWVTLSSTRITITPGSSVTETRTYTGNVLWIRAVVETFTAGTIIKVQYSN